MLHRVRLDLAYDGSDFSGWAKQPGLRTVQGVLEESLALVLGAEQTPVLTVAGRTDVGVHASAQVAHVDLTPEQWARLRGGRRRAGEEPLPPEQILQRRLRGILGQYSDLSVHRVSQAPEGFDARFSARWRRYEYRLADASSTRHPLERGHTTWINESLDEESMHRAAQALLGLHDFASFCRARDGATTIRSLLDFGWERDADGVLHAHVKADAFCHSMVRALVGACVAVGAGKLGADDVALLRDAARRSNAFAVMPARGLILREVDYPADASLAPRAVLTRARRTAPEGAPGGKDDA
ncbi:MULTISPECIES: tRNA pseudouridine(38-40) synthase TruA [unclassified Rathayibacter]|uniref:tRNA pseudouridine(38-40) synthase TruA n=1 Tax=unclassified Rathayibacter TaxID=2609250 RepID=UPI00188CB51E|nr:MULTISPECIES: tRNA pseudouridine(38-40) synthase TruA [unclassified Rathayibacter]MBF4461625.1 tRNA pseudouridine(38-40) synthase TruA [Rathayibacter sp. VKM Ac-2879]MBF4503036.1 tRNA pseudouridine(38-40) synthase TruA [Rathayibacter sp. VKM Ac-2878]